MLGSLEVNVKPGIFNILHAERQDGTLPTANVARSIRKMRHHACGHDGRTRQSIFALRKEKGACTRCSPSPWRARACCASRSPCSSQAEGELHGARTQSSVPAYPMKISVVTLATRRCHPMMFAHNAPPGFPLRISMLRAFRSKARVHLNTSSRHARVLSSPSSHIARTRWRKLRRSHALQRRTARPPIVKCPFRRNGHRARTRHHDRNLVGDLRASPTGAAEAVTVQTSQLAAQLRSMGSIAQRQQQRISMQRFRSTDTPRDPYSKTLGRCSQATLSHST